MDSCTVPPALSARAAKVKILSTAAATSPSASAIEAPVICSQEAWVKDMTTERVQAHVWAWKCRRGRCEVNILLTTAATSTSTSQSEAPVTCPEEIRVQCATAFGCAFGVENISEGGEREYSIDDRRYRGTSLI